MIINRELDPSEQRKTLNGNFDEVVTGATLTVGMVPFASVLEAWKVSAMVSISGTPVLTPYVFRFIAGSGLTAIAAGGALTVTEFGTSGVLGVSTYAGSSLLPLLAGDVCALVSSGANAGIYMVTSSIVIRPTQDYKATFGL